MDGAIEMEKQQAYSGGRAKAVQAADKRLVKLLVPAQKKQAKSNGNEFQNMMNMFSQMQNGQTPNVDDANNEEVTDAVRNQRLSVADQLKTGR